MDQLKLSVDILCGDRKPQGFIGVDILRGPLVDIVADLNRAFPFKDSSVDYLRAHDAIEHLKSKIFTMNEIYRVLKNGAIAEIRVPSTDGRGAFQDPTHVSYWNLNSFFYYSEQYPEYLMLCKKYGFKGRFRLLEIFDISSTDNIIYTFTKLMVIK